MFYFAGLWTLQVLAFVGAISLLPMHDAQIINYYAKFAVVAEFPLPISNWHACT